MLNYTMSSKKKVRTDKQREEERCGGCDCYETEDGCECRRVPCSKCGSCDNLYNMNHREFHTDYWFNGMSFYEKMDGLLCDDCVNAGSDSEEEEYNSD